MNDINLSVIGSCRVYSPIERGLNDNFKIAHGKTNWFTHSTRDVIQKIKVLNNYLEIPEEYVPLVINDVSRYFPEFHREDFFIDTDVFVIEISSIQSNYYNGYELQQWCLRDVKESSNDFHVEVANNAKTMIMTYEDIYHDLELINAMLLRRPIIFVSHNLLKRPDGSVPKPRPIIQKALSDFSLNHDNAFYFDPTEVILEHGVDSSMKDLAHYNKEFELVIGDEIFKSIKNNFRFLR